MACKDNNFLCNNGKCILWIFTCNNINNCGDNSDESGCDSSNAFIGKFFGGFFGSIIGVLLLITGIIIAVLLTCVYMYKKKCLLYKQRRRRNQPPVVIIAPHEENIEDNASKDEQGELIINAYMHVRHGTASRCKMAILTSQNRLTCS